MNLSSTIIPKSDQLNADDLIAGPRTIKITSVEAGSREQPVHIRFDGDDGRPYKPSKSMRRVLVALWGTEGSAYVGKRITIFREPTIKFGGEAVGGIRISHASGIGEALSIALTETRGKRKPFRVLPLGDDVAARAPAASFTAFSGNNAPATAKAPAGDVPVDEQVWAWSEVGDSKAAEGVEAFRAWWRTLPDGDAKRRLLAVKVPEWKKKTEGGAA